MNSLFIFIIFIAIIVKIVIEIRNTPKMKGKRGEKNVNNKLTRYLNSDEYTSFTNITIPTTDGSTQIDQIVFSKYGIFVIETKNMQGWIFGKENDKNWTQQIFKKKTMFQNPIRQNYKHMKSLEAINIPFNKMHSLIIFTNKESQLKNNINIVMPLKDMIDYILSFREEILTRSEIAEYINILQSVAYEDSRHTDKMHINNLNKRREAPTNYNEPKKVVSSDVLKSRLKKLRMDISKKEKIKAYMVFTDATLDQLVKDRPKNKVDFLGISGVGKVKLEKYGQLFLDEINKLS